ncbi:MAG: hypothetical protein ACI4J4_00920 [Ruminiclostridium sp.]
MSISEKLGRAFSEIESAADEAITVAKEKIDEKLTPEKKAQIKQEMKSVGEDIVNTGKEIGRDLKEIFSSEKKG